ncbi:MAG: phosphate acetyltransferase [Deltaproteobacteria bacterium]|nr:MAG: phosphate acetyltransferase [Deltaproteobacteria bacterium]
MRSLYLTTPESNAGKSLVALGILETISRTTQRIGVFCPVIENNPSGDRNKNIDLLLTHFQLDIAYEDTYALTTQAANDLLAKRQYDDLLNTVIQKYRRLEERYDFVLCLGSDYGLEPVEFNLNVEVARSLDAHVLILANAFKVTINELIATLNSTLEVFKAKGCPVVGIVANRVRAEAMKETGEALQRAFKSEDITISTVPNDTLLASPTIREIAEQLNADVLYGADKMDRLAYHYMVIAMQMQNYLSRLKPNSLLVTPGDRGEIILSALQAQQSTNYPPIAGLVLATGEQPAPTVKQLLDGLPSVLPIIAVETETYETVTRLNTIRSHILPDSLKKIETSLKLFEEHIDMEAILEHVGRIRSRGIPPKRFLYNLMQWAQADRKRIILPESSDPRILKAAETIMEKKIADIILLGKVDEVKANVNQMGLALDLHKAAIIDPVAFPDLEDYAHTLYTLRKHKGLTEERALETMHDISYFGTMMVYKGDADGMVSGAQHTTAHTIRPAFQIVKTKPGISVVSSVFFMCLEDRVLIYGDCAVVPKPTAEELAEIAITSAETAKAFGIFPRVALLSYSSGTSGSGEEVERVRKATKIAQERRPDLLIEGPIQYDAAVDEEVGHSKMPGSKVAGRATVLIFPDLNTGNNTYKAVQRETGAIAIGPVLQGLNKPVNDLSRGCTVEDIINTVAITAIQAQHP